MHTDSADPSRSPAWHDLSTVPTPTLATLDDLDDAAVDVIVIGLGASGLEAVAELASRGVDVVGLDAHGIAAGAAGANGGFLLAGLAMFHHDAVAALGRELAGQWYRRTVDELDRLAEVEPTFRRIGSLRTAATEDEFVDIRAHLGALAADAIPAVPYEGTFGRGLVVTGDGVVDPVARCRRLATQALADGATLVGGARVECVAPNEVVVAGRDAPLRPRRVLVAVDGGLERLVPQLAGRVRTARLQMLATGPDAAVAIDRPLYHRRGRDYAQQLESGEVLLGGGRDVEGERTWSGEAEPTAEATSPRRVGDASRCHGTRHPPVGRPRSVDGGPAACRRTRGRLCARRGRLQRSRQRARRPPGP